MSPSPEFPRESDPTAVASSSGSRLRILETVLRITVLVVSILQVAGIVVFLKSTGFDFAGMQEVLGGAGMAKMLLVPLVFLLGSILFAFRRPESVWVFSGYLGFWLLQAPFNSVAFPAFSHSLVALALLQALKDAVRGGDWGPSGAFWAKVKEFVQKQDRGPWWVLSFAALDLYGLLILDVRQILVDGSGVVSAAGIALPLVLGGLVLAGAISFFRNAQATLPFLGGAVALAALWWVFEDGAMGLVPVGWTSLLLVCAYLKPSVDAWLGKPTA